MSRPLTSLEREDIQFDRAFGEFKLAVADRDEKMGRDRRSGLQGEALPATAVEIAGRSANIAAGTGAAGAPGSIPGRSTFDLIFAAYRRMITNPFYVRLAIYPDNPNPIWAGDPAWYPDEGGEDLDELREAIWARQERGGLTEVERANLDAALMALDDFGQMRKDRER